MAIRVCKGKYNIIKDNKIDYTFLETDDNNKFIIATDKNQVPKYYIYKDNKIYDKFINLEDIYISGKNILKDVLCHNVVDIDHAACRLKIAYRAKMPFCFQPIQIALHVLALLYG